MGVIYSLVKTKPKRIIMIGLDNSGKTTILYSLKLGTTVRTTPTIGFNLEQVKYKNLTLNVWDIGGQDKLRALWHHYYNNNDAVLFVVDSNDEERYRDVLDELCYLANNDIINSIPCLIYLNKSDLRMLITEQRIYRDIHNFMKCKFHIQVCSAQHNTGISEGLDWLKNTFKSIK